jgi:tetratricopeptide (TPR) repeat protein
MDSTPSLADWLAAGRYLDVLLSDAAVELIKEFVSSLAIQQQKQQEEQQTSATAQDQTKADTANGSASVSSRERVLVGLAALNAFLQANVTGPVLEERKLRTVQGKFVSAKDGLGFDTQRQLRKACLRSLEVDGVSVYELVPLVEVFCLARWIILSLTADVGQQQQQLDGEVRGLEGAVKSREWMALRVRVWHYKLLTQPSLGPGAVFNKASQWCDVPSLRDGIEKGLEDVGAAVLKDGKGWSRLEQVQFLVEKANVCIMLGQDAKAREALGRATELSGFVYALSGALGKRTRFQEKSTSQLVVLAKSGEAATTEAKDEQAKPQALALNDDTLLENLEFTKEKTGDEKSELPAALGDLPPDEQPQLAPLDQIILLAEATLTDSFSPADTLTAEEVLPFAVRVISDKSTNWQIYTHALLVRSRIEVHRSRTIERGVLQMQAVVDQVIVDTTESAEESAEAAGSGSETGVPEIQITADGGEAQKPANKPTSFFPAPKPTESAPAQVRLEHIHALSSPPRWHLESELAYSWAGVGSLVSALEIFKRLRLWAEVALCFASNAAKDDEDGRGSSGEAKAKAVLRWQLFRKTGTLANYQDASDEDEDMDLDDLKEADYHGPERQPAPPNAPRLWCILGDIENDPRHYERAWEISKHRFARAQRSLGEYYLQQKNLGLARQAYKKAVAINRLSAELWNRLGDISLRMGDFSDAAEAFGRAIAAADNVVGGEDARTWSNLGSALYSLYVERIKELKQQREEGGIEATTTTTSAAEDEDEDEIPKKPNQREPSTLLTQSLAAYKRGASIAHDNWRIWDNVVTLASRLRPIPMADLLLALRNILRIRSTEEALDIDVLRLLVNEALLSQEKKSGEGSSNDKGLYEPPRGSTQRAVCDFLEGGVVPLITVRSELWELVTRERVWRGDFAAAVDAAERAWRAAVGGVTGAGSGGALLPTTGGGKQDSNWLEDREGWKTVVERTDELVSMLENYGEEVPEIGARWKGKARSAVRSVMGKAKESWEGSDEWERLMGLLEGLM